MKRKLRVGVGYVLVAVAVVILAGNWWVGCHHAKETQAVVDWVIVYAVFCGAGLLAGIGYMLVDG